MIYSQGPKGKPGDKGILGETGAPGLIGQQGLAGNPGLKVYTIIDYDYYYYNILLIIGS